MNQKYIFHRSFYKKLQWVVTLERIKSILNLSLHDHISFPAISDSCDSACARSNDLLIYR